MRPGALPMDGVAVGGRAPRTAGSGKFATVWCAPSSRGLGGVHASTVPAAPAGASATVVVTRRQQGGAGWQEVCGHSQTSASAQ